MALSCFWFKLTRLLVSAFAFVLWFGVLGARIMTTWTRWNTMTGNPFQQPWQQNPTDSLGTRLQQRLSHVAQFLQGVFVAQAQRIFDSLLFGRLHDQPTYQQVQQHMSRDLVTNAFRSATAQPTFHALSYLQFQESGFDFPTPMIKPWFHHATGIVYHSQANPFLSADRLGVQDVGHHRAGPKSLDMVVDLAQRHGHWQAGLAPLAARVRRLVRHQAVA